MPLSFSAEFGAATPAHARSRDRGWHTLTQRSSGNGEVRRQFPRGLHRDEREGCRGRDARRKDRTVAVGGVSFEAEEERSLLLREVGDSRDDLGMRGEVRGVLCEIAAKRIAGCAHVHVLDAHLTERLRQGRLAETRTSRRWMRADVDDSSDADAQHQSNEDVEVAALIACDVEKRFVSEGELHASARS